jgi:diguanylate cyclase
MKRARVVKLGNLLMSVCAGIAAFIFTLVAFLLLKSFDEQLVASMTIGLFALLIVWVASEKPNSGHARAVAALIDRLLKVGSGDLSSPAPEPLRRAMPALAAAVDGLFEQVRSTLDDARAMALYDPVTSLPNRVHFRREADRILKARQPGDKVALLFIDLDGFKEVNDRLGHAQGDQVLMMVAERLRQVVEAETEAGGLSQTLLARLAGDEFTLLLPTVSDAREAERIAHLCLTLLRQPYETPRQPIEMGASIGVALCPRHGIDLTVLMKAADIAMYHAKGSGRSQVCIYHERLTAAIEEKATLEKAFRDALSRNELQLVFQPQLCARTNAVVAGEAVLLWDDPVDGLKLPGRTEEGEAAAELSEWMFDGVMAAVGRWHAAGMTQRLQLELSGVQLDRTDFFKRFRAALSASGAPASLIELKIGEALIARCSETVLRELAALRSDGVAVALADFGSGACGIGRVKNLPLDRVQLDRLLTDEVDTCDEARTIVTSLIHLIHGVGCEAVADGVQRAQQFEVLRAIGCDVIQGYTFPELMREAEFAEWIRASSADQRLPRTA